MPEEEFSTPEQFYRIMYRVSRRWIDEVTAERDAARAELALFTSVALRED
jgi:hypothetical protein